MNQATMEDGVVLLLNEKDFPQEVRASAAAVAAGGTVLGAEDDARRVVFDALPRAVAQRVAALIPAGFRVGEIAMKLELGGQVFGVGLSGDVEVKCVPDEAKK